LLTSSQNVLPLIMPICETSTYAFATFRTSSSVYCAPLLLLHPTVLFFDPSGLPLFRWRWRSFSCSFRPTSFAESSSDSVSDGSITGVISSTFSLLLSVSTSFINKCSFCKIWFSSTSSALSLRITGSFFSRNARICSLKLVLFDVVSAVFWFVFNRLFVSPSGSSPFSIDLSVDLSVDRSTENCFSDRFGSINDSFVRFVIAFFRWQGRLPVRLIVS